MDRAIKQKPPSDTKWWTVDAENIKLMLKDMNGDNDPCRCVELSGVGWSGGGVEWDEVFARPRHATPRHAMPLHSKPHHATPQC